MTFVRLITFACAVLSYPATTMGWRVHWWDEVI